MKKIYLSLLTMLGILGSYAQTSYTTTAVSTAWNTARWNNTADAPPYTSTFTANNAASFTAGTYTFAGMGATVNVGNVTVANGVTVNFASNSNTYGTGSLVRTIDVGSGGLFDLNSQAVSTAAGTGFIKTGAGVFATGAGTFTGGFTINAGTVIARGTTGMGGGGSNTLTLNGGTLAANASRTFVNTRFPGGIVIGGDIQLGEIPANVTLASNTANLTFDNNVSLGGATRTITLGNAATYTFTGVISNTSGGLTLAANANGTAGTLVLSGANTYSGATNINGGILTCGAANTIPATATMTLGGGTLRTGATTGFTQSTGTLNLTSNSNIILGTGVHSLSFANSSAVTWTAGQMITITGWTGAYNGTSGTAGKIFVGSDASGLTAGQLAQIQFFDGVTNFPASILSTGEVVAGVAGGTPDITLSSPNPAVAAGNILQGSTSAVNSPIYRFDLTVATSAATLTGVIIKTNGTYAATDITNFKCWYSSDAIFNPASDVLLSTITTGLGIGSHPFTPFTNQVIASGTTGYIFITADLPCTATVGNNMYEIGISTADISFLSGNLTGSAFDGGLQTIIAATPNNVTAPAASVANASSSLSWTIPAGCYDEILIAAAASVPNTGNPTGDGTAYTANPVFGSGSLFGNGFVVYKGTASPQLVTGLINGTPYYYKFFTRFGTTWSSGVEVTATPVLASAATDYFRSVASGSWNTLAIWESSNDSTNWIPATLIPGALAAHVVIQNPDSVWLAANTTTANLTLMSGAKMNALTFTMTATVRFNLLGTATFYQGGSVTTVPGVQQVLSPTSNYHFNGTQAGTGAGAYPEFGNLYWEPTPGSAGTFQNSTIAPPYNSGLVIRGDMTINIQGGTAREVRFATGATTSRTHTINGNLNIISSSSVVVAQNGSNTVTSIVNIGGNINISAGIFQGTSSSAGTNGNAIVNLSGNLNNTGGTIQTGASTAGIFNLNFTGTNPQSINNAGGIYNLTANQNITINNSSATGVTLNTPISLPGNLTLTLGNLNTTAVNLLTLGAASTVSGASNASYVNGPLSKIGNTDFTFPVGKNNCGPSGTVKGMAALNISSFTGGTPTDQFTAEYIRGDALALGSTTMPVGLDHISRCDYWTLNLINGTPVVNLTLFWDETINNCVTSAPYVNNLPSLTIAHFNGTNWNNFGVAGNTTGTPAAGTVTWSGVGTFSPFAIASVDFLNPLPITINYLNGGKQGNNHLLSWLVSCNAAPRVTMYLERSSDGVNFSPIYNITADAVRCGSPFDFTDAQPLKGSNYYRLRTVDINGRPGYSGTVLLINASSGMDVLNIAPNPVYTSSFKLGIGTAKAGTVTILITDMQGRTMLKQQQKLVAGFNNPEIAVGQLAPGMYNVTVQNDQEKTVVKRFIKQ